MKKVSTKAARRTTGRSPRTSGHKPAATGKPQGESIHGVSPEFRAVINRVCWGKVRTPYLRDHYLLVAAAEAALLKASPRTCARIAERAAAIQAGVFSETRRALEAFAATTKSPAIRAGVETILATMKGGAR